MENKTPPTRADFGVFYPISTRWMDNDAFGHVNNVVYYSYYDAIINRFIALEGKVNFQETDFAAFIVYSQCFYHSPVSFPEAIDGAFKVNRIGNSSIEYGVAVFKEEQDVAAAHGTMTHVFVDKSTNKPVPIPKLLRELFERQVR